MSEHVDIISEIKGPAEALIQTLSDPQPRDTEGRRGVFKGLFRFTLHAWLVNLWPLVVVSALACAVALLAAALIEGTHTIFAFTNTSLGITLSSSGSGSISSTSLGLQRATTFTGLITIATGAWAGATMVVMLLRHMREGRRAKLADLACGLRYWPWVVLVALLDHLIAEVMNVATDLAAPFSMVNPIGISLNIVITSGVTLLLGVTIFAFYVQEITDAHRNALTSLGASWRTVFQVGFWRVLGNRLLFTLCLVPLVLAESALNAARITSWGTIAGPIAGQALGSVVIGPLPAAFATVMYLLARGDRDRVEAVLGRTGRSDDDPRVPY
jgi:hypothetical protein